MSNLWEDKRAISAANQWLDKVIEARLKNQDGDMDPLAVISLRCENAGISAFLAGAQWEREQSKKLKLRIIKWLCF